MKVLHVIPAVAPRYGGPSSAIVGMGQALIQAGTEVLVATTDADGPGRVPSKYGEVSEYHGVPTIFFPRQVSESFKYSRPLAQWLAAHVEDFDAVHVHAVYSHSSIAAASACRRAGVPYVVRPLGSLDPWSRRQKRWLKRVLWHTGVKEMLRGAAAVHYTTEAERSMAERGLGLERGVVIYNGVDDDLFSARTTAAPSVVRTLVGNGERYCLIMSRLHPKKGIEAFLDAWLAVTFTGQFKSWKLIIAGDGDAKYVSSLKRQVSSREATAQVQFVGWVSGASKIALLSDAEFLALTSQQENFGIAVAEALACGTPVLVSERVGLAAEVENSRLGWVTTSIAEEVKRSLTTILAGENEMRERGAAGRAYARQHFVWSQIAQDLISLYSTLDLHAN